MKEMQRKKTVKKLSVLVSVI